MIAVMATAISLLDACGSASSSGANPSLVAIKITPANSLILLAGSRQLTATGVYSDGSTQNISSQVAWSASSAPNPTNFVEVSSSGVATGMSLGASVIGATLGTVTGLLQLTVDTNGFSSGTTAILTVPFQSTDVDAAYLAESQSMIQGAYAVQEVNLDADQFSSVLPVPVALLASIPMPVGFVPNATVASLTSSKVAVISYMSPDIQIIDASNDATNNTVIATFTAPISKVVTFNGNKCMICAAVVNPTNDQLILSTAQGYYAMDLGSGTFTPLPFTPTAFPAQSFALNPIATEPYILSPTFGQNPNLPSEVQILNLTTNSVVTSTSSGLTSPLGVAVDVITNYAAIVDANASNESLGTLAAPADPLFSLASDLGVCAGQPPRMNMVALGATANANPNAAAHTLFSSQTAGNCVGFQVWPNPAAGQLAPSQVYYGYGPMPATPDGPFVNGNDPNTIATFTSVVDKKNYGLLVDANEDWVAKINLGAVLTSANIGPGSSSPLPAAVVIPPPDLQASLGSDPIRFLPTPATAVTLSATTINFGSPNVGTSSPALPVTLSYIGATLLDISSIVIQGADAGDFAETDNCSNGPLAPGSCTISITFSPTATGMRSATLAVTDDGGDSPQIVSLSGTGT
jgi:hypothetical protein